jgi:hypothetical protein
VPGESTININEMSRVLTEWWTAADKVPLLPKHGGKAIKGRSFRRGGASAMVGGSAPLADTMVAGRWKTGAMPAVYADEDAKAAQALQPARALQPPEAADRR